MHIIQLYEWGWRQFLASSKFNYIYAAWTPSEFTHTFLIRVSALLFFVSITAIYTATGHRAAGLCAPRHRSRHVLHELLGLSGSHARVPLSAVDGKWSNGICVGGLDPDTQTVRFKTESHLQVFKIFMAKLPTVQFKFIVKYYCIYLH